jgi:hypothetical protein
MALAALRFQRETPTHTARAEKRLLFSPMVMFCP